MVRSANESLALAVMDGMNNCTIFDTSFERLLPNVSLYVCGVRLRFPTVHCVRIWDAGASLCALGIRGS